MTTVHRLLVGPTLRFGAVAAIGMVQQEWQLSLSTSSILIRSLTSTVLPPPVAPSFVSSKVFLLYRSFLRGFEGLHQAATDLFPTLLVTPLPNFHLKTFLLSSKAHNLPWSPQFTTELTRLQRARNTSTFLTSSMAPWVQTRSQP